MINETDKAKENLTTNFKLSEFACKDGSAVPDEYYDNCLKLAENLQALRDFLGVPIFVVSGYRTKEYNAKVGGAPKSQHLYAKAADIRCKEYGAKYIYGMIEVMIEKGLMHNGGLGIYNGFVHYDIRDKFARWQG